MSPNMFLLFYLKSKLSDSHNFYSMPLLSKKRRNLKQIAHVFSDILVKEALPKTSAHFVNLTLVYSLINAVGFKIFNLIELVNNIDVDLFSDNNST